MKFDIHDSLRRLALLLGMAGGGICYVLLSLFGVEQAGGWALMTVAVISAALYLFFWVTVHFHHNHRYENIPQSINAPILLKINAYLTLENVSRNGFFYLTAEHLICHFRDRQPYVKIAFDKTDILKIDLTTPVRMLISGKTHTFEVVSTEAEALAQAMQSQGWPVYYTAQEK